MHQLIALNHIGFTTDTIVQANHVLQRTHTPVFRFESHTNHRLCVLRWPSQQSPHLLLYFTAKSSSAAYSSSPTCEIQVHGLVVRPIATHVSSHVVSRSLIDATKIQPGLHLRNDIYEEYADSSCYCRKWKVTLDPGRGFPKIFNSDSRSGVKQNFWLSKFLNSHHVRMHKVA